MTNKNLTVQGKIQRILDGISNCHPTLEEKIRNLDPSFIEETQLTVLVKFVRKEILGTSKPLNRTTKEYWIVRCWPEKEAKQNAKINGKKLRKGYSPFSKEFWIEKGYSEQEAEYLRNSKRPIRKEYWIEKGYSEEEAIQKAIDTKDSNNKAGGEKTSQRPKEERRKSSNMCIEYYLERGYSEKEAKEMLSERQRTFTLEKCIERHGMSEGIRIWEDRQNRWQKTLRNKPQEEIDRINKNKNAISLKNFDNIEDCIEAAAKRNIKIFSDLDSFMQNFLLRIKEEPYIVYWPLHKIMNGIPNVQKEIIDSNIIENSINPYLKSKEKYLIQKSGKQAYRRWEDEGLLRSSYEIYFFDEFKKRFPNKNIKIDNCYPNSNFRYDFLIDNTIYVEISPEYDKNKSYRTKMDMKEKVFGCVILKSIEEINHFLENLE